MWNRSGTALDMLDMLDMRSTCGTSIGPLNKIVFFLLRHLLLLVYQLELLLNLCASIIALCGRTHLEGAWVWCDELLVVSRYVQVDRSTTIPLL